MADATSSTSVKIGDISAQLTKASRLAVSTDGFWIQTGSGQSVLIPAEFVRAYLADDISPSIGDDGYWYLNGESLGVKAEGVTPQLRGGTMGIEVSYDKGATWTTAVKYSEMDIDLETLEAEYKKLADSEQERQTNEYGRETAEEQRVSEFNSIKEQSFTPTFSEKNNRLVCTLTPVVPTN